MNSRLPIVFLAVLLGLLAGWGLSRFLIDDSTFPEKSAPNPTSSSLPPVSPSRSLHQAPRAHSATSLAEQREEYRKGRPFSPYRDGLFSLDLALSLSPEEILESYRLGTLRDESEIVATLTKLARINPAAAFEVVNQFPERGLFDHAQRAVLGVWAARDPAEMMRHLTDMPASSHRAEAARIAVMAWGEIDPVSAIQHLDELAGIGGPLAGTFGESLLSSWVQRDPAASEAWVAARTDEEERAEMLETLQSARLGQLQGAEALDYILSHPDNPTLQTRLPDTLRLWALGDPTATVEHFATYPKEHPAWTHAGELGSSIMLAAIMQAKDATVALEYVDRVPEGKPRRKFLEGAAAIASSNNIPSSATAIIAEIPESHERAAAVGMLTELWMRQDPVALSEWLASLEPSSSRDSGISHFVTMLAETDPERARQWKEAISDQK
ncbi:MAG: hypothetical protein KDN22_13695 [Verrucomicrobiae bacterium]|nr:hypothetical protein [Verrucomicrobiae bacterium]